jgi:hypothetical protein
LSLVVGLIVLAFNGFPLMRKRVGRSDLPLVPRSESPALTVHRVIGFATESLFSFAWPFLLGLVFRFPTSRLRRIVVAITATFLLFDFSIVAVSAYMLPRVSSAALPTPLAATILRFAIFHVSLGPMVAVLLLITLAVSALSKPRVAAG